MSARHGGGISGSSLGEGARTGNKYGLRITNMPTSTSLSTPSLISTPFSGPQAPPFEYPYPTPNSLSVSSVPYASSNTATYPFSLSSSMDVQTYHLSGTGFPMWKHLSKMKGMNGINLKPPMPPGLMQKAALLPSSSEGPTATPTRSSTSA